VPILKPDQLTSQIKSGKVSHLLLFDGPENWLNGACSVEDVQACLTELQELLQKYCGGEVGEQVLANAAI